MNRDTDQRGIWDEYRFCADERCLANAILATIPVAVWAVDCNRKVVYLNKNFSDTYHVTVDSIDWTTLIGTEDLSILSKHFGEVLFGHAKSFEFVHRMKTSDADASADDSWRWVSVKGLSMKSLYGQQLVGATGVTFDIDNFKKLQDVHQDLVIKSLADKEALELKKYLMKSTLQ